MTKKTAKTSKQTILRNFSRISFLAINIRIRHKLQDDQKKHSCEMMHDKLSKTQYSWEISTQWMHRVHSALIGVNISDFRSFQWFTKIIFLNFNDQQSWISYNDLSLGEFVFHLNRFSKHGDLLRMLSNNSCIKLQTHVSRSSNSNKKSTKTSSLVC